MQTSPLEDKDIIVWLSCGLKKTTNKPPRLSSLAMRRLDDTEAVRIGRV